MQLARLRDANVIGLAGERNHDWLRSHGVVPVEYGEGQVERIRAAAGGPVAAFIDTFGGGYVQMAIEELGVAPGRINTIADFPAIDRFGVHGAGTHSIDTAPLLAELLALVAAGRLELPIARTYPLSAVREAFTELARRRTHGKIVLIP